MRACFVSLLILGGLALAARADVLELAGGNKLEGQVVARDARSITFTAKIGDRSYTREYPLDKVVAVTVDGNREVIGSAGGASGEAQAERSPEEVKKVIEQLGGTRPDWWDSVALNYPQTLDLSWPDRPPPPWDNQRNVGQYIWDVINPNPARWREGARFVHHLLSMHRDNPALRDKAMRELARMYQDQLRDFARAAFWWQKAGVDQGEDYAGVQLAECYWRLGSKAMAVELLGKTPPSFPMIKLWAELGEIDYALQFADANANSPAADVAFIYAGDACRFAGRTQQALEYYQRVLSVQATGRGARRVMRNQQRAASNIEAVKLFDMLDLRRVPDGKYRASSLGFESPLTVDVTVRQGRIEAVDVVAQQEKQPYSALIETPARIIAKQSVKGIDTTSRATITSEAVINATAKALAGAMK